MTKGYIASLSLISVFTDTAMCVPGVTEEELITAIEPNPKAGLYAAVIISVLLSFLMFFFIQVSCGGFVIALLCLEDKLRRRRNLNRTRMEKSENSEIELLKYDRDAEYQSYIGILTEVLDEENYKRKEAEKKEIVEALIDGLFEGSLKYHETECHQICSEIVKEDILPGVDLGIEECVRRAEEEAEKERLR